MTEINFEGQAYAEETSIQLTNSFNKLSAEDDNNVGRATYYKPIHLWDDKSGNIADFTTYFSFIINSHGNESRGNGFAFFLTNKGSKLPPLSGEGRLGLLSYNSVTPPFVAVEFDTRNSFWDPVDGDEHIGIDLNSLSSIVLTKWTKNDIVNGGIIQAWIEYNSTSKNLSVHVINGYEKTYMRNYSYNLDCLVDFRKYLTDEWVTVGFSASTAIYKFEEHEILEWNFNSTLQLDENFTNHTGTGGAMSPIARISTKGKNKGWILVVLGSIGALVLVSSVLGLLWCGHRKKRRSRRTEDDEPGKANDDFEREDRPRSFSYEELVTATNNFASERLLGKGGFGRVYIGMLSENSCVAVKKIITSDSHQGFKAYVSEVKAISRSRHRNLVQLIGWCRNKQELFIVYEFMPNKSLDFHLFNKTGLLTWERRNSIALGLASALLYLQEECEQCVLHRDIKSSNVLLDSNFNAKLGDFGLATFVEHGQGSDTTRLIGTDGYVAPEYLLTSTATKESDVYSFGVVALEIASGRPASKAVINENGERCQGKLVAWVWEQYRRGNIFAAADPQLHQNYDREEMERLIVLGLACAHPNHSLRPSIREALDILNAKAPLPKLPLDMPIATYQLNMNAISESSSIDAGVSETKFSGSSVNS
uniref:non-specific serine/threonine protein kinase n=1 Tax=Manihot esculenta TaxID=3983 RepID=A0A2C9VK18_MANES